MIKIDEQFSIKNYGPGWELHHTVPKQDGEGFVTKVTYHGSLRLVAMAIIDKSCGSCADGTALMMCIMQTGERVASLLGADNPTT